MPDRIIEESAFRAFIRRHFVILIISGIVSASLACALAVGGYISWVHYKTCVADYVASAGGAQKPRSIVSAHLNQRLRHLIAVEHTQGRGSLAADNARVAYLDKYEKYHLLVKTKPFPNLPGCLQ